MRIAPLFHSSYASDSSAGGSYVRVLVTIERLDSNLLPITIGTSSRQLSQNFQLQDGALYLKSRNLCPVVLQWCSLQAAYFAFQARVESLPRCMVTHCPSQHHLLRPRSHILVAPKTCSSILEQEIPHKPARPAAINVSKGTAKQALARSSPVLMLSQLCALLEVMLNMLEVLKLGTCARTYGPLESRLVGLTFFWEDWRFDLRFEI